MDFVTFRRRAEQIFAEIPPHFREGVDGLVVERESVPHPELPEIYTLGECRSDYYPSEFGGAGEVRSLVYLYHGSFVELARLSEGEWDWEGELWETITHEVRHHLESLASEDALEEIDYAEDQNFARREGEPFEPLFFRSGERVGEGVYRVDADLFVEREVDPRAGDALEVEIGSGRWRVPVPRPLGDVHLVRLVEREEGGGEYPLAEGEGEAFVVMIRRMGLLGSLRALFRAGPGEVRESDAVPERVG